MNELAAAIRAEERRKTVERCIKAVEDCKVDIDVIGRDAYGRQMYEANPLSIRQYEVIIDAIKAVTNE